MTNIFEEAKGFIKDKRYSIISENMIDVGSNNVCLIKRSGCSMLTCSCTGSSRFGDNNLCSHKIVFLDVTLNKKLHDQLDKSIKEIETYKKLGLPASHLSCLDVLYKLKKGIE